MKTLAGQCLVALLFLAATSLGIAGALKSKIITSGSSALAITVHDGQFLKITNFTQEGGDERGVVAVTLTDENGGTTNVLAAVRIDLSTGSNSQNPPETNNPVRIAGPAQVAIAPVSGATLFISYKKESNESGGGGNVVVITPTPAATVTPTPSPTATP